MDVLVSALNLLTGLGVFMFGMKTMSGALKQASGGKIGAALKKYASNPFTGAAAGAIVTAAIQSSSAVSVMVVSMTGAGIINLLSAAYIIIGANVGTTFTGLFISLGTSDVTVFLAPLCVVGLILAAFKNPRLHKIGMVIGGAGLVFAGLGLMRAAFVGDGVKDVLSALFQKFDSPLALIAIGAVFTALTQSSTAVTGLLIVSASQNAVDVLPALYAVLGANIGTCVTAVIAGFGEPTEAKRAAFIHLVFNFLSIVLFAPVMAAFPDFAAMLFVKPFSSPALAVAWFNLISNVICAVVALPFAKLLVAAAQKCIRENKQKDTELPAETELPKKAEITDDATLNAK